MKIAVFGNITDDHRPVDNACLEELLRAEAIEIGKKKEVVQDYLVNLFLNQLSIQRWGGGGFNSSRALIKLGAEVNYFDLGMLTQKDEINWIYLNSPKGMKTYFMQNCLTPSALVIESTDRTILKTKRYDGTTAYTKLPEVDRIIEQSDKVLINSAGNMNLIRHVIEASKNKPLYVGLTTSLPEKETNEVFMSKANIITSEDELPHILGKKCEFETSDQIHRALYRSRHEKKQGWIIVTRGKNGLLYFPEQEMDAYYYSKIEDNEPIARYKKITGKGNNAAGDNVTGALVYNDPLEKITLKEIASWLEESQSFVVKEVIGYTWPAPYKTLRVTYPIQHMQEF